jgi:hypothetical protein
MPENTIDDPQISIDRGSKQYAIFNGFRIIREFQPYTDEAKALEEAKAWVKERTTVEPFVMYPRIKSIRMWG